MRKTASAPILLFLLGVSTVCFEQIKVQAQSIVTIGTDGSVLSPSASIQQTGNAYTVTSDMGGYTLVERSNITLDVDAPTLSGLLVNRVSNVTLKNFIVKGSVQFDASPFGL